MASGLEIQHGAGGKGKGQTFRDLLSGWQEESSSEDELGPVSPFKIDSSVPGDRWAGGAGKSKRAPASLEEIAAPEDQGGRFLDQDGLHERLDELKLGAIADRQGRRERKHLLDRHLLEENEKAAAQALLPTSAFKSAWDVSVLLTLALAIVASPLLAALAPEMELSSVSRAAIGVASIAVLLVLVADMLVTSRTSFIDDGVYIHLPRLIGAHYFNSRAFVLDALAAFPLRLLLTGGAWRGVLVEAAGSSGQPYSYFEFVCLWELIKLQKLFRTLDALRDGARVHPAVASLAKILLGLSYMWLWMGALYYYVSIEEEAAAIAAGRAPSGFGPHNYMPRDAPVSLKLARSVFWGICVTAGIGPDIEPESFIEVLYTSLCSLLSVSLYALVIGSAANSFAQLQAPLQARRRRLEQLNEYMHYKRVPMQLRMRVNSFFEYRGLSLLGVVSDTDVMGKMPHSLNAQLSIALNQSLFSQVPLFADCSANLLLAMVSRLVPLIHMPADLIIREGTEGRALFFINRGQCLVLKPVQTSAPPAPNKRGTRDSPFKSPFHPKSPAKSPYSQLARLNCKRLVFKADAGAQAEPALVPAAEAAPETKRVVEVVAVLSDSDFFGEGALLTSGITTSASVKALTYCDLLALFADDFHAVIRDFPYFAAVVHQHASALHKRANLAEEDRTIVPDPSVSTFAFDRSPRGQQLEIVRRMSEAVKERRLEEEYEPKVWRNPEAEKNWASVRESSHGKVKPVQVPLKGRARKAPCPSPSQGPAPNSAGAGASRN